MKGLTDRELEVLRLSLALFANTAASQRASRNEKDAGALLEKVLHEEAARKVPA